MVIQNILRFLDTQAATPKYFGFFHIFWIAVAIATAVALCILWKKEKIENVSKLILIVSVVLLVLGLYKQIVLSFEYDPQIKFVYNWANFPWHFMSIPLIIGLFIGATSGLVNKYMLSYYATFGLLAGLWGLLDPNTFGTRVGVNVYHMLCYSLITALSVLVLCSQQIKLEIKTFFKALPIFIMSVGIAISFNEITHLIFKNAKISLFALSRHFESDTPVYSALHNSFLASGNGMSILEYVICVLFYLLLVSVFAFVPFLIVVGLKKLFTTDFDLEYGNEDKIALAIRQSEGLDPKDDGEEIFTFNGKVNSKKNTYRQTYFKNLNTNFGKNNRGSCGYVALSMLLTYYDTILCDNIVPREFDAPTSSEKEPNLEKSPGAKFVFYHPAFEPEYTTYRKYVRFINRSKNHYLHEHLLKIALKKKLNDAPETKKSTDFNFGADVNDIKITADYYLDHDAELKRSEYNIETKTVDEKTTHGDIRNYVIGKIKQGYPVLVLVSKPDEEEGHAVVAYDYDEKLDKIYCHFGWQTKEETEIRFVQKRKKEVAKKVKVTYAYTRLVPEEKGYCSYDSALVIDFDERKISHTHTDNYEVAVRGATFFYCPDGTYTTRDDLIVEFNKNKRKMSIVGVYGSYPRKNLTILKKYGKVKITSIGKGAFKKQKHIQGVILACDIDCVPKKAFKGCKSVTRLGLPGSIKKLKAKSFAGCTSLTTIVYGGTTREWYKIKKSSSWDRNTGRYKVYCTDGIIYKFGADHVQIL